MTRRGCVSLLKLNSWLEEEQGPVMGLNPRSHHSLSYPEQTWTDVTGEIP